MNIALVMMGGSGTRFGAAIPKQFVEVEGRPVFSYLVEAYQQFESVDAIVIVCHCDWKEYTENWCRKLGVSKLRMVIDGGQNRSHSVQLGLDAIRTFANEDSIVLIHDVTHPFIDRENVDKCIDFALQVGSATLVGACFDTMYKIDEEGCIVRVENRDYFVSATAPECFRLGVVWPFYEGKTIDELALMTSVGAMMVSNGMKVHVIKTPLINLKITLNEDMTAFKKLLHGYYYKDDNDAN